MTYPTVSEEQGEISFQTVQPYRCHLVVDLFYVYVGQSLMMARFNHFVMSLGLLSSYFFSVVGHILSFGLFSGAGMVSQSLQCREKTAQQRVVVGKEMIEATRKETPPVHCYYEMNIIF